MCVTINVLCVLQGSSSEEQVLSSQGSAAQPGDTQGYSSELLRKPDQRCLYTKDHWWRGREGVDGWVQKDRVSPGYRLLSILVDVHPSHISEIERETDRQTDRQRDIERETERETEGEIKRVSVCCCEYTHVCVCVCTGVFGVCTCVCMCDSLVKVRLGLFTFYGGV